MDRNKDYLLEMQRHMADALWIHELPDSKIPTPGIHYPDSRPYEPDKEYIRIPLENPDINESNAPVRKGPEVPQRGVVIIKI